MRIGRIGLVPNFSEKPKQQATGNREQGTGNREQGTMKLGVFAKEVWVLQA